MTTLVSISTIISNTVLHIGSGKHLENKLADIPTI